MKWKDLKIVLQMKKKNNENKENLLKLYELDIEGLRHKVVSLIKSSSKSEEDIGNILQGGSIIQTEKMSWKKKWKAEGNQWPIRNCYDKIGTKQYIASKV